MDESGFDSWLGEEISHFLEKCRPSLGPPRLLPGTLSLGLKLPGHAANAPLSCRAEVNNAWSYSSTSPYAFMACAVTNLPLHLPQFSSALLVVTAAEKSVIPHCRYWCQETIIKKRKIIGEKPR